MAEPKSKIRSAVAAPPPSISDAEWVVMKVLWEQGTATANQVVAALQEKMAWKPKTIHTLLRRLLAKRAVAYDKIGREFHYRPIVDAQHCTHAATRSFLDRFFDGHLAPFLAGFLERERLSRRELEELRRILDRNRS
ncbi:MAG: BlaI/MecI/CopY family transcriptional regulator [Verrucomicrobiota bacterium]